MKPGFIFVVFLILEEGDSWRSGRLEAGKPEGVD
jgi:hypothetical protein